MRAIRIAGVIARYADKVPSVANADMRDLSRCRSGMVIFLDAELAEPEERERRAILRRQTNDLAELVAAFGEFVERVIRCALVPVAFDVCRLELDRFRIERDGLVPLIRLASLGRRRHEPVEFRTRRAPPACAAAFALLRLRERRRLARGV